jgi:hypothetical protein
MIFNHSFFKASIDFVITKSLVRVSPNTPNSSLFLDLKNTILKIMLIAIAQIVVFKLNTTIF